LLLLGLGGGAAWYLWQQHLQQAEVAGRVEEDLKAVRAELSRGGWREATAALERAEARLPGANDKALAQRVAQARKDRDLLARLDEARLRMASPGGDGFDRVGADRQYVEVFRDYGLEVERLNPEAAAARVRTSALSLALLDALDDWAGILDKIDPQRARRVRAVADGADDDPWRRRLRQAYGAEDRAQLRRVLSEPVPEALSPSAVILHAIAWERIGERSKRLEVLKAAQRSRPGDFWLTFELAVACDFSGPRRREEAVRYYTAALALRPDSAATHFNLGAVLYQQGKFPEAVAEHQEARRLNPSSPQIRNGLGLALLAQGKLPEASAEFQEALRLNPDFAYAHTNLGFVLKAQGQLPEAIAEYRKALRLMPDDPLVHNSLGIALQAQGQLPEAIVEYREALRFQPDDLRAHTNLGHALEAQGKPAEAVA
jgi:Flp pilus assembly protein TadD